jgi:hypothetical protein
MDQRTYDHLEKIKGDLREEIKKRIEQRDKYSIQLTVVLAALVAITFSERGFQKALLAVPLASIYFTVLILYSYRVHRLMTKYLREVIEPRLAEGAGSDPAQEWETYYQANAIPGIRKGFFMAALWVVTLASVALLYVMQWSDEPFRAVLVTAAALYVGTCALIWKHFREG